MKNPQSVERARAYLDAEFAHHGRTAGSPGSRAPEGPFVTISREAGSGGSSLAVALAERLNSARADDERIWSVFDQQLIEQMLRDANLSTRLAQYIPEDRVSEINASVGEIVGLHPNLWSLVQRTNQLMRALARGGHVILVGRGSNFATAQIRGGLHVRLVAPMEERARRIAGRLNVAPNEAMNDVKHIDAARRAYVRSVFNAEVGDSTAYDVVLNTGRFSIGEAADFLAVQVQRTPAQATA